MSSAERAMNEMDYVIGVDGGGTKTALTAVNITTGDIIAASVTGSINSNYTGVEKAVSELTLGIRQLNLPDCPLALGIGDPASDDISDTLSSAEFRDRITSLYGCPVCIHSDAYMALYGLTGGKPGCLMIAGTGAMGIAEDSSGKILIAGGWGRLTGDEGGGYYIGLSGVKAALRYYDGIAPETELLAAALGYFDCTEPRDLIGILCGEPDIAGFSKEVKNCAENGDGVSEAILLRAASYLAGYASVLKEKAGTDTIGVYGSVLVNDSTVRGEFERIIRGRYPDTTVTVPSVKPELAAAYYAINSIKKKKA